jgi:cytochrome c peroxidase
MKLALEAFKPIPSVVPAIRGNAVTHEKVELGKLLFFDPRFSTSEIISCNPCHNLATGGVDAGPTSVGHGWQKGPRRAPTVYNAVFNVAQFWDGRAVDLKAQAKSPVPGKHRNERDGRSRRQNAFVDACVCRLIQEGVPQ